ncbi:MAG: helix-turn-helix domain-containing protein, partial [Mycobacteriaceae bacterium]
PGARIRCAGPSPLVVLRDLDRWTTVPPGLAAALRASRARLAATAMDRARCTVDVVEVLAWFRRSVTVPPLRNRARDLAALVTDVLADVAPGRDVQLSAEALRILARHGWPGNMVELRDALDTAVRRRPVGVLEIGDLPESCQSAPRGALRPVDQAERDAFVAALRQFDGNRTTAATALGVARSTLYRKIAQYGITA